MFSDNVKVTCRCGATIEVNTAYFNRVENWLERHQVCLQREDDIKRGRDSAPVDAQAPGLSATDRTAPGQSGEDS